MPVARTAAGRPPRPRRLLVDDFALQSMGAVVLARRLLGAFREAVVGWWETDASGSDTEPAARDQGELFAICRGFEISLESLPRLDRGAADPLSGPPAPATEPGERAQDRLAQLADRVLRELGDAVSGGRAPLR